MVIFHSYVKLPEGIISNYKQTSPAGPVLRLAVQLALQVSSIMAKLGDLVREPRMAGEPW